MQNLHPALTCRVPLSSQDYTVNGYQLTVRPTRQYLYVMGSPPGGMSNLQLLHATETGIGWKDRLAQVAHHEWEMWQPND